MQKYLILFLIFFVSITNLNSDWSVSNSDKLHELGDLYNVRGSRKNIGLNISPKSGNMTYNYLVDSKEYDGHTLDITVNYCNSAGVTAYAYYNNQNDINNGWHKLHKNKPLWVIGVNGFVVQAVEESGVFICDPKFQGLDTLNENFSDSLINWTIDGYDVCTPMKNKLQTRGSDVIKILRTDGSMLELVNPTNFGNTDASISSDYILNDIEKFYTGVYFEKGINNNAYAIVEYEPIWNASMYQVIKDGNQDNKPTSVFYGCRDFTGDNKNGLYKYYTNRTLTYFPGDGLVYKFKEIKMPYGKKLFCEKDFSGKLNNNGIGSKTFGAGDFNENGDPWINIATPSIFYLVEVRNEHNMMAQLDYSWHLPAQLSVPFYSNKKYLIDSLNLPDRYSKSSFLEFETMPGRARIKRIGVYKVKYENDEIKIAHHKDKEKIHKLHIGHWQKCGETAKRDENITITNEVDFRLAHSKYLDGMYFHMFGYLDYIESPCHKPITLNYSSVSYPYSAVLYSFNYDTLYRNYKDISFPYSPEINKLVDIRTKNYVINQIVEPQRKYQLTYYQPDSIITKADFITETDTGLVNVYLDWDTQTNSWVTDDMNNGYDIKHKNLNPFVKSVIYKNGYNKTVLERRFKTYKSTPLDTFNTSIEEIIEYHNMNPVDTIIKRNKYYEQSSSGRDNNMISSPITFTTEDINEKKGIPISSLVKMEIITNLDTIVTNISYFVPDSMPDWILEKERIVYRSSPSKKCTTSISKKGYCFEQMFQHDDQDYFTHSILYASHFPTEVYINKARQLLADTTYIYTIENQVDYYQKRINNYKNFNAVRDDSIDNHFFETDSADFYKKHSPQLQDIVHGRLPNQRYISYSPYLPSRYGILQKTMLFNNNDIIIQGKEYEIFSPSTDKTSAMITVGDVNYAYKLRGKVKSETIYGKDGAILEGLKYKYYGLGQEQLGYIYTEWYSGLLGQIETSLGAIGNSKYFYDDTSHYLHTNSFKKTYSDEVIPFNIYSVASLCGQYLFTDNEYREPNKWHLLPDLGTGANIQNYYASSSKPVYSESRIRKYKNNGSMLEIDTTIISKYFGYDMSGNIILETNNNKWLSSYNFDALDRISTVTLPLDFGDINNCIPILDDTISLKSDFEVFASGYQVTGKCYRTKTSDPAICPQYGYSLDTAAVEIAYGKIYLDNFGPIAKKVKFNTYNWTDSCECHLGTIEPPPPAQESCSNIATVHTDYDFRDVGDLDDVDFSDPDKDIYACTDSWNHSEDYTIYFQYKFSKPSDICYFTALTDIKLKMNYHSSDKNLVLSVIVTGNENTNIEFKKNYLLNSSIHDINTVPDNSESIIKEFMIDLNDIKSDIIDVLNADDEVKIEISTTSTNSSVLFEEDAELVMNANYNQVEETVTSRYIFSDIAIIDFITNNNVTSAIPRNSYCKIYEYNKIDDIFHSMNDFQGEGMRYKKNTISFDFGFNPKTILRNYDNSSVDTKYQGINKPVSVNNNGDSTQLEYDGEGRIIKTIYEDNSFTEYEYEYGLPTNFAIDINDTECNQDYFGYCSVKRTIHIKDIDNALVDTTFIVNEEYYDMFGRLRKQISDVDSMQKTIKYAYDETGNLIHIHVDDGLLASNGQSIKYYYDEFGRVRYKYQCDQGFISYAYDKVGNIRFKQTQKQAMENKVSLYQYDDLGRMLIEGEAVIDIAGLNLYEPDYYTLQQCEQAGRLTDLLDPDVLNHGLSTYDLLTSNPTLWTNRDDDYINKALDGNSILKQEDLPIMFEKLNSSLGYNYNYAGPSIFHSTHNEVRGFNDPRNPNHFENIAWFPDVVYRSAYYDELPPSLGTIWKEFPAIAIWDAMCPETKSYSNNTQNKVRNLKGEFAAVAYRERNDQPFTYIVYSYDERGRVEAELKYSENIGFEATYYKYNSMNKVMEIMTADPFNSQVTQFRYDGVGRVESMSSSLPIEGGLCSYNSSWNPASPQYPNTDSLSYSEDIIATYDIKDQLTNSILNTPINPVITEYTYNSRGFVNKIDSKQGVNTLYDETLSYYEGDLGLIKLKDYNMEGQTSKMNMYSYDNIGQLKIATNTQGAGGDEFKYTYDLMGNRQMFQHYNSSIMDSIITTYGYNTTGSKNSLQNRTQYLLSDNKQVNQWDTYQYYPDGGLSYKNAQTSLYDPNNQVWQNKYIIENYDYNPWGQLNRFEKSEYFSIGNCAPNFTESEVWRYCYSPVGKRESKRLFEKPKPDNNGNIYPWVYYAHNSMWVGFQQSDPIIATAGDDISNPFLNYPASGGIWDSVYYSVDRDNAVFLQPVEYNSYGAGSSVVWKRDSLGQWQKNYKLTDHLGSVRATLDHTGAIQSQYDYKPFGEQIVLKKGESRETYIDKEKDNESQLADHGVRKYDNKIGRFTSPDVLWEKYSGWSPYHYSRNDPINKLDANGLDVVILQDENSAYGKGHTGILIGDDEKGWRLYSKNGSSEGWIGPSDQADIGINKAKFDSFEDFIKSDEFKTTRYEKGYWMPSNMKNDKKMQKEAKKSVESYYIVVGANCMDAVSTILLKGGFNYGYNPITGKFSMIPNNRYEIIKEENKGVEMNLDELRDEE